MTAAKTVLGVLPICDAFGELNRRRADMDMRIMARLPDDPEWDELWQDLQAMLAKLRDVVNRLAETPAAHLAELRAKAAVLATLMRTGEEDEKRLALSLADDIAQLDHHPPGFT
jgi:hypothetical protein